GRRGGRGRRRLGLQLGVRRPDQKDREGDREARMPHSGDFNPGVRWVKLTFFLKVKRYGTVRRAKAGESARRRAGANAPAPQRARPKRDERTKVRRAKAGESARRRAGANAPAPHRARPKRDERTKVTELMQGTLEKARILVEALPWISRFRGKTVVV